MQITKVFSGTMSSIGTTSQRPYEYGKTGKLSRYWDKINLVNQSIADFLRFDCGVDASYEARGDDPDKYLWIFGVPCLFYRFDNSNSYFGMSTPYTMTNYATTVNSLYFNPFSSVSSGEYKFSVIFTGNAQNAFALRFKNYTSGASASIASGFVLRFVKCTNLANGRKAVVIIGGNSSSYTVMTSSCYGIELDENGVIIPESINTSTLYYLSGAFSNEANRNTCDGKFPLIPIMFGIWKSDGLYCHLGNFEIPAAMNITTEIQTEFEVSGRKFINTTAEGKGGGYINLGLIEVTE